MRDNEPLPFCRIGPSSSDRWGSASLMYTTEPLRPPTFPDLLRDIARCRPMHPYEPGLSRIDLSVGARDAILRSPYMVQKAVDSAHDPFDWSSPVRILGIPVVVDPNLPDNHVVFRDRQGNVLHTVALAE